MRTGEDLSPATETGSNIKPRSLPSARRPRFCYAFAAASVSYVVPDVIQFGKPRGFVRSNPAQLFAYVLLGLRRNMKDLEGVLDLVCGHLKIVHLSSNRGSSSPLRSISDAAMGDFFPLKIKTIDNSLVPTWHPSSKELSLGIRLLEIGTAA